MATGDSFDQFETLLTEFIDSSVIRLVLEDDDPIWAIMDIFKPVTRAGRDTASTPAAGYEASWRVMVQEGGRIAAGSFAGNDLEKMGKDTHLMVGQAASAKYLDPTLTPLDSWIKIFMLLKRAIGSITINEQQILARLASDPIDQVAGDHLRAAASKVRRYMTNGFWGDGSGQLAQVNDSALTTIATLAGGTTVTIDGGTFARFGIGDLVQFGNGTAPFSTQATLRSSTNNPNGYCRVVNIDRKDRTLKIEAVSEDLTVADDDYLFLADTYQFDVALSADAAKLNIPEGVNSLLLDTGTFPGSALDVDHHSVLKSFITDTSTTPVDPTPEEISLLIDAIADAGMPPPEALFFERSGWTRYAQLEREAGAQYVVPQGAAFMASGGVDGPVLQHMGNRFQRFTSVRMPEKTMIGLAPSTWRMFLPIGPKGTIHWAYSTGTRSGHGSIFGPVHSGIQLTELSEAPFNTFFQVGCDNPMRNFRHPGLKVARSS